MTRNHDYNTPQQGTSDWDVPINENFEKIDRDIEIRDRDSNKGSYEPKDGAKFFATDTGNVYLGDGSAWNAVNVGTSSENPNFSSVNAKETYVTARQEDVIVYQDGDETRAVGDNGVVASGTNPSTVIEEAIRQGQYIAISGDYALNDEITVTDTHRVIDASGASFTANGDHKLWHFNGGGFNRFFCGELNLGDSGRVGLDLHASMANQVSVQLDQVPGGTFTEDDGVATGTYDRCGIRLKGRSNRGTFWNRVFVSNPYGMGQSRSGTGMIFTTTEGSDTNGGNANWIHAAKLTDYDIGIDMKVGTGNTFCNLEVTNSGTGLKLRERAAYGSGTVILGKAWFEICDQGVDIPPGEPKWDTARLKVFGEISFGGMSDSATKITNRKKMLWTDVVNKRDYRMNTRLTNHKEGRSGADPSSQSPSGWLEIVNQNGEMKYVPYYG